MDDHKGADDEILFRLRMEDLLKAYLQALDLEFSFAVRASLTVKSSSQKKYWATALMRLTAMRSAVENDLANISRLTGNDFETLASTQKTHELAVIPKKDLLPAVITTGQDMQKDRGSWWGRNLSKRIRLPYFGKKT